MKIYQIRALFIVQFFAHEEEKMMIRSHEDYYVEIGCVFFRIACGLLRVLCSKKSNNLMLFSLLLIYLHLY